MATTDAKAEARVLFETTNQTQAEIAKAVGRSVSTISRWAARENWQRPGEKNKPPREPNFSRRRAGVAIGKRIHSFIIRKLDEMEKGMEDGTLTPEAAESGSKMISSMIGGFDKAVPNPNEGSKRRRGADDGKPAAVDEVARLQREIIERFERIERRREAARGSE